MIVALPGLFSYLFFFSDVLVAVNKADPPVFTCIIIEPILVSGYMKFHLSRSQCNRDSDFRSFMFFFFFFFFFLFFVVVFFVVSKGNLYNLI